MGISAGRTLIATFALTLTLASGARAADHLLQVSEVQPSAPDPTLAFVELRDAGSEPFPAAAYTLASRDESDQVIGQQTFAAPYGFANTSQPFLVGAAGVQPRDATLTISLSGARKVCFYRGTGTGTANEIHCLAFSAVPDDRSAQLTTSETVVFACPTPDAPNNQTSGPCSTADAPVADAPAESSTQQAPPDSGGSPPPPTTTSPPTTTTASPVVDERAPAISVSTPRTQRLKRLRIRAVTDEQATLAVSGFVRVQGRRHRFVRTIRAAEAGATSTIRIRLRAAGFEAVGGALRRGERPTARIRISARDAAGNDAVVKRAIALRL